MKETVSKRPGNPFPAQIIFPDIDAIYNSEIHHNFAVSTPHKTCPINQIRPDQRPPYRDRRSPTYEVANIFAHYINKTSITVATRRQPTYDDEIEFRLALAAPSIQQGALNRARASLLVTKLEQGSWLL